MYISKDSFNVNKNLFNSVTNMSNVSNPFGFFPTLKLSAGRNRQVCGYKFAERKRFLIGYLSQEMIRSHMARRISHFVPKVTAMWWSNFKQVVVICPNGMCTHIQEYVPGFQSNTHAAA